MKIMRMLLTAILLTAILIGCSDNPSVEGKQEVEHIKDTKLLRVTKDDVVLSLPKDGLGIAEATYQGKPFTGVIEDFQGYFVAEYAKDSLRFTSGFAFYTEGRLDSVVIPMLSEKRYFNGDNLIDSIYSVHDGQTNIFYFKDEQLIDTKVIIHQ